MEINFAKDFNQNTRVHGRPHTGLENDSRNQVVDILNDFLADEAVLSQKIRGVNWHARGAGFSRLYSVFNSQIEQLNDIADGIAARVRKLGGNPAGCFMEFLKRSRLKEQPGDIPEIKDLLADHKSIIHRLPRAARKCSEEFEDEVTRVFLIDFLHQHEKMISMLQYYIEDGPSLSFVKKGNKKHEFSTVR